MSARKDRINAILQKLSEGLYERDEIVAVALLAALCGEHAFLLGPPGTAKSLIARRISQAFETEQHFEMLMHRFSTPEDIFGPVSIKELKEDKYVRNTEGYLPQARFAFLDEIWKSSPAILNTLLTIVNERKFHNGTKGVENVPLKSVVAASNETPPPNQGLEALYDRFVVRLHVKPAEQWESFAQMLEAPANAKASLPAELKIKNEEWEAWQQGIAKVRLSKDTLKVIENVKAQIAQAYQHPILPKPDKNKQARGEAKTLYISDRLWQKAAKLMKAAAFFCDREETNLADALLLRHCLWSLADNRNHVVEVIETVVEGFDADLQKEKEADAKTFDKEKISLEKKIAKEFGEDTNCGILRINNEDCIQQQVSLHSRSFGNFGETKLKFYIPLSKVGSSVPFFPWNAEGSPCEDISCLFDGGEGYELKSETEGTLIFAKSFIRGGELKLSVSRDFNYLSHRDWNRDAKEKENRVAVLKEEINKSLLKNQSYLESSQQEEKEMDLNSPFVLERDVQAIASKAVAYSIRVSKSRLEKLNEMISSLGEHLESLEKAKALVK